MKIDSILLNSWMEITGKKIEEAKEKIAGGMR